MHTRIDWSWRNFLEISSSSVRNPSIIELITSVNPRTLTLRIEPRMEVVKLIRFSVARSQLFCLAEMALPMANEEPIKTRLALLDNEHHKAMIGETGRLTYHHQNRSDTDNTDLGL